MIDTVLPKLFEKKDLSPQEVEGCFQEMTTGMASDDKIAEFLRELQSKGESAVEIVGAVKVLQAKAVLLKLPFDDLVDNCGTGGDGASTFNISTAAALIAAAAGAHVAKHGNRSASSLTGSADVLEALGVKIDVSPEVTRRCIEKTGFCFLFAPLYHPAMKHVAKARRSLGVRTIFNLIGPLLNPAGTHRQLVGVCSPRLLDLLAEALMQLGCQRALVVCGMDGLDEITLTTKTETREIRDRKICAGVLDPQDFGLDVCSPHDLKGQDAIFNARIIEAILKGEDSPRRDAAALNAGALLYVAGRSPDIKSGLGQAQQAIDSGKAFGLLSQLRIISNNL